MVFFGGERGLEKASVAYGELFQGGSAKRATSAYSAV